MKERLVSRVFHSEKHKKTHKPAKICICGVHMGEPVEGYYTCRACYRVASDD